MRSVAERAGASNEVVRIIHEGLALSIRRSLRTDEQRTLLAIAAQLEACLRQYCGAVNLDEATLESMVSFIADRFGSIGVGELEAVFSLSAAGCLGAVDLSAYYGNFTVAALGKILQAYEGYRASVLKELQLEAGKPLELTSRAPEGYDHDKWRAERLQQLIAKERLTHDDLLFGDYEYYVDRTQQCQPTKDEKLEVWELSIAAVNAALMSESLGGNLDSRKIIGWVKHVKFHDRRIQWCKAEVLKRWIERQRSA